MSIYGKKKMSEKEVAELLVFAVSKSVQLRWPGIANDLNKLFEKENFSGDNLHEAYEFALVIITSHIQALQNLFSSEQANRIKGYILQCVSAPGFGEYPRKAIQGYQNAWDQSLQQNRDTRYAVNSILYDKLGCKSTIEINDEKFKDPVFLLALEEKIVTSFGFSWKNLIKEYEIYP